MEVVDIDLDNISFGKDIPQYNPNPSPSVSFGGGIELLMNEKKKSSSSATKMNSDDLTNLENELNDLTSSTKNVNANGFGNFFGLGQTFSTPSNTTTYTPEPEIHLGQATKDTNMHSQTWDGFSKVVDEIPKETSSSYAPLNDRDKRRKKRIMIKKLEEWAEKGNHKHGSHFTMDSNYEEVEDEYESAMEEKRKKDSIKLQGWWFSTVINTLEYGNALLNPFDLNLDGWGEQVSEDLDSYEEIFSELHDKYKGGKMAPEVSLLLRIGFSAAVVNMSNKMLSSATPGFNDVMKQSPELMKMFTSAAVETMSKQNSAFDFAKTMMNPPNEVNTKFGPPPAPVDTKTQGPIAQRPGTMQYTTHPGNRPDLVAATAPTPMFRDKGIELNSNNIQNQGNIMRPEMKGPQLSPEIEQLLSGLKSKPVNTPPPQQTVDDMIRTGNNSVVSVSSLMDLEGTTLPKKTRTRRHNTSNKTIALDI